MSTPPKTLPSTVPSPKTYAESQGQPPFDWLAALSRPCAEMTNKEVSDMCELSLSWVTCACGNQCEIIPRSGNIPQDVELRASGSAFYGFIRAMASRVCWKNYDSADKWRREALETLRRIEARSAELIAEILTK